MTTVSFIGAGNIGGTVARLAVTAGHDVVLSNSRGPETLADLVAELGPNARAATSAEAAAAGDLVVLTIPLKAVPDLPAEVKEALAGRVVVDTGNYYPQRDGQIADLDENRTTTSSLTQGWLPGARIVKAFNNIYFGHLGSLARPGSPVGAEDRSALAIAGDDAEAKATATAFIESIGYDVLDTGSLADSWRFERDRPAYGVQYAAHPEAFTGGGNPGDLEVGRRATAAELEEALAAAVR